MGDIILDTDGEVPERHFFFQMRIDCRDLGRINIFAG